MSELVTLEDLQKALPSRKNAIPQEVVEVINKSLTEPEFQGEDLLRSLITYESVMVKAKCSISEYVNAVRFCAYLTSTDDNYTEAYKKTFCDREFVKSRLNVPTTSDEYNALTSAASRYRKSKLVVDILTLAQVPFDLMFTGARYKAIAVLTGLMETAKHDKDKIAAADKLLVHTANTAVKMDISVGPNQNAMDMQERLNEQLAQLAINQKRLLEGGHDIRDVQKTGVKLNVIEGEYEA